MPQASLDPKLFISAAFVVLSLNTQIAEAAVQDETRNHVGFVSPTAISQSEADKAYVLNDARISARLYVYGILTQIPAQVPAFTPSSVLDAIRMGKLWQDINLYLDTDGATFAQAAAFLVEKKKQEGLVLGISPSEFQVVAEGVKTIWKQTIESGIREMRAQTGEKVGKTQGQVIFANVRYLMQIEQGQLFLGADKQKIKEEQSAFVKKYPGEQLIVDEYMPGDGRSAARASLYVAGAQLEEFLKTHPTSLIQQVVY